MLLSLVGANSNPRDLYRASSLLVFLLLADFWLLRLVTMATGTAIETAKATAVMGIRMMRCVYHAIFFAFLSSLPSFLPYCGCSGVCDRQLRTSRHAHARTQALSLPHPRAVSIVEPKSSTVPRTRLGKSDKIDMGIGTECEGNR